MIKYALLSLESIYRPGYRYKKVGVVVSEIVPLFDGTDRGKQSEIMKTMDRINAKYGRDMIKTAIQGVDGGWKMRQAKLSLCYTTKWEDIIIVRA